MYVVITVREMDMRRESVVEVRHVGTPSKRKLTAVEASKILRREFPDLPRWVTTSKSVENKGVFFAMHSVEPTKRCNFHYVWRKFYLAE